MINEKRIDRLIDYMRTWVRGKIIYPSQIKSLLVIDYSEVYKLLEIIKDMGILEYSYEIYCSACEKFVEAPILESLNEFPKEIYCDSGKHRLNPLKDTILIFRVVSDGK
jgi:hypothetical protein